MSIINSSKLHTLRGQDKLLNQIHDGCWNNCMSCCYTWIMFIINIQNWSNWLLQKHNTVLHLSIFGHTMYVSYVVTSKRWEREQRTMAILFSPKMYLTSPHFPLCSRCAHSNSDSLFRIVEQIIHIQHSTRNGSSSQPTQFVTRWFPHY
jgi:hypothetical protein